MDTLMRAALDGNVETVRSNLHMVRLQTDLGFTALMYAARNGHFECARVLVVHEARIRDRDGRTALIWAAMSGNADIVELLSQYELRLVTNTGWTALMNAVLNDHEKCVKLLLGEVGFQSTESSSRYEKGTTALIIAATRNYFSLVSLLCQYEAKYRDVYGRDALWHAKNNAVDIRGNHVKDGHPRIIQLLSTTTITTSERASTTMTQAGDGKNGLSMTTNHCPSRGTQNPPPQSLSTSRVDPKPPIPSTAPDPGLKGQLDGLQVTLDRMTTRLQRTQDAVQVELHEFRHHNKVVLESIQKTATELEKANQRISDLLVQVALLQQQVDAKDAQIQEAHSREGACAAELKLARHSNLRLRSRITSLKKVQSALQEEVARYKAQASALKCEDCKEPIGDRRSLAQDLQETHLQLLLLLEERGKWQ